MNIVTRIMIDLLLKDDQSKRLWIEIPGDIADLQKSSLVLFSNVMCQTSFSHACLSVSKGTLYKAVLGKISVKFCGDDNPVQTLLNDGWMENAPSFAHDSEKN